MEDEMNIPQQSTKERLSSIVKGFAEFDVTMKKGTRTRRENEEIRILNLKAEVHRLNEALSGEIQRRIESNKAIQLSFQQQITVMTENITNRIEERKQVILDRLDEVQEAIVEVTHKLEFDKAVVLQRIEDKGDELIALLADFKVL